MWLGKRLTSLKRSSWVTLYRCSMVWLPTQFMVTSLLLGSISHFMNVSEADINRDTWKLTKNLTNKMWMWLVVHSSYYITAFCMLPPCVVAVVQIPEVTYLFNFNLSCSAIWRCRRLLLSKILMRNFMCLWIVKTVQKQAALTEQHKKYIVLVNYQHVDAVSRF